MTDIEIASAALIALGTGGISSFDDDTDEARACKAWYPIARDKVLSERVWSFAKGQYILAPDAQAPLFGFSKRFLLPAEIIRAFRADDGSGEYRMEWEVFGRYVHADVDKLYVVGVKREEDTSLYSPGFTTTLALRLAVLLAVPLKENRQLKADLWQEYQFELKEAGGLDGSQGKSERLRSDWLSRARGGR